MENEKQQPHQPTTAECVAAIDKLHVATTSAFENFGEGMLTLIAKQKEAAETINQMLADRNKQLDLIAQLTNKLAQLSDLQNSDHEVLTVLVSTKLPGKSASN